jgi:4-azaleucine resistance transporter AzlC
MSSFPGRGAVLRAALGIGVYAAAFGATFGAVSTGAGLSLAQTMVLSAVMFTGASQFAFAGVVAAGGAPVAAVSAALLLGLRNAFYGIPVGEVVRPRGMRGRVLTAHFVIDETTAMAVAQDHPRARRYAYWATAASLFLCWVVGTLAGALVGSSVDPAVLGLDAAGPAVFLALLWPQLRSRETRVLALLGAVVAVVLIPVAPGGVPVVAAAGLALLVGLVRTPPESAGPDGGVG